MSLIKCPECGKEVSDKAESCPNCGCPVSYSISTKAQVDNKQEIIVKKKSGGWFAVLFVIIVIIVAVYPLFNNPDHSRQAIDIVKCADLYSYDFEGVRMGPPSVERYIEVQINRNKNVYNIYGWEAKKVDDNIYFVSFDFDYDNSRDNGCKMYCYEVDVQSEVVREVTGNDILVEKYQDLGFID